MKSILLSFILASFLTSCGQKSENTQPESNVEFETQNEIVSVGTINTGAVSFTNTNIDMGSFASGALITKQTIQISNNLNVDYELLTDFSNLAPFFVSKTTCGTLSPAAPNATTIVVSSGSTSAAKLGRKKQCSINIQGVMGSAALSRTLTIAGQTITLNASLPVPPAINLTVKESTSSSPTVVISSLDAGTLIDNKTVINKVITVLPGSTILASPGFLFPIDPNSGSPISIAAGSNCSSETFSSRATAACNIPIKIDPNGFAAGTYTSNITFSGTNRTGGVLNVTFPITVTIPADIPVACTVLNSGIANVASVSGNIGECVPVTCLPNFEVNTRTRTCDALLCALPGAISPLNNSNGRITAIDTTKSVGSCTITSCAVGSEVSADGKSCVIQKCSLPSKILPLDNSNGQILTIDTTKDVGVCAIETCAPGFVISSDKKSCVVPKCSLTNLAPLNNSNGKILTVDTTKDVGSCTISTCAPGFVQSSDSLSCVPKKCSMPLDISPINNSNGKVISVDITKDVGSCEVLTCDSGYVVSSDKQSCIVETVSCTMQNAVGNGLLSIDGVESVKGNHPSCLVDTCIAGATKSVDEKSCNISAVSRKITVNKKLNGQISNVPTLAALASINVRNMNVDQSVFGIPVSMMISDETVDYTTTQSDLEIKPVINIQHIESGTISPGYKYLGAQLDNGSIQLYQTAVGLVIPVSHTADHVIDLMYEVDCSQAGTVSAIRDIGVVTSNVSTYKKSADQLRCIVDTCVAGATKSVDEKSCIVDTVALTVIRGSAPQDLKCSLSIAGSPMINDNSMVIDGGSASTINMLTANSSATVSVGTCAPGYEATLKSVVSDSDFTMTPGSAVECILGVCNIQMDSPKFVKMDVTTIQYPFASIAMLESMRLDQGSTPFVTMTVPATTGGLSDALNFSFNVNDQVYTQDCATYSSSFGSNAAYNPIFPGCASVKFSDIFEFKNWELSVSGLSSSNLNDQNLAATVVATPSTTENIVVARFDAKPATISSDIDLLTSNSYLTIYPQQEDYIELISKFYDKNLNNQISSVQLKMKNSSGTDISNIFQLTCIGITLNGNLSSNLELKNCLNSGNYINVAFSDYSSVIMTGDAYEDSLRKDDFRTGTYTAEFTVKSSSKINDCVANIPGSAGCPDVGTRIISVPITISADNDFNPTFSVYDATVPGSPKLVTDHLWTSVPYASNVGGSGFDYVIGQSTVRYATSDSAHTSPLTVPLYRNMDYAFNVGFIADSTPLNVKVDLTTIQNKNLAYNSFIRISDVRNNHSCMTVRNRRIGADSLSFANTSLRKPLNQISDFSGYNTTYIVKAQSAELVKDADTRGCSTTNSGIAAAPGAAPLLSEKYDFIGNDNWTCEAGEVCYVNNLSDSSVGAAKIAQRTFRFRVGVRNENNEVNFSAQRVRVEKADSNVSLGIAGASVNVAPLVDERFDSSFEGQLYSTNFTYDFAALTWQDTRSPLNSKVKVTVPSVSGLDCSSGCEYSFISYKNTMADYPNGTYPNSYLFTNNDLTSAPVYSSNPYGLIDMGSVELYDHNVEVLALVKKNNMTYRKIIDIAATNKIRSNPVMYMITSVYSGGSLTKLNLKYDLNKYDNNGAIVYDGTQIGAVQISPLSYGISVRQGLYSNYVQTVDIASSSNLWDGTNWLPGTDFDYTGTNLNFNKLARIWAVDGDFYHYNFNFKQCPESTPYYLYAQGLGWGCYDASVAQANYFLP